VLESIRRECGGDAQRALLSLLQYWLANDSHTSWQKLALAFRETGYKSLSAHILDQESGNESFNKIKKKIRPKRISAMAILFETLCFRAL